MDRRELQPDAVLKKSPFLVVKKLNGSEVRVYSKLHGNLKSYEYNVSEILKFFDSPIKLHAALDQASAICPSDLPGLIAELYENRFLVEGSTDDKELFLEYVESVRRKNRFPRISKVTFLTSGKCNLACKGCYHHFFDFKSSCMTSDFAGHILEGLFPYLKRRKISSLLISFLGYEPLLNFETISGIYDRACRMGREYAIETSFKLFSNAFLITGKIYDWILNHQSNLEIMVSLDGIKDDNDRRRMDFAGRGTHEKVIGNLKRILETRIKCRVITVLSKLNLANIEKFVDEMAEIGVQGLSANIFCGQTEEERQIELTASEKFEALQRMELATEKHGIDFDGEWKFAVVQMITGAYFSCPAGIKQLVFSADGVIYPCQRFAGTNVNYGRYDQGFWEELTDGRCTGYNHWIADLYGSVANRVQGEEADLTGWSCPFVPFMRGECLSTNFDRELNEKLLDFYASRPLDRIFSNSAINY